MGTIKRRITAQLKSAKGFTLIELITAMALMSILIAGYFSLFFAGGKTYDVIYDNYKTQNEARIAMSFITVKIRQNDRVVTDPDTGVRNNAVLLDSTDSGVPYMRVDISESTTEYIYAQDGSLMVAEDLADIDDGNGRIIAEGLNSIVIRYPSVTDMTKIEVIITYNEEGRDRIEQTISLRAQP